jgi:methyl-accepting chemotaxis protein
MGGFFYHSAVASLKGSLQARLGNSAAFIAGALNGADFDDIRTPQDVAKDSYQQKLELLRRLQRTNPDISYLYIMRNDQGRIRFVVDTDETAQQALPMRVYHAEMPAMRVGFSRTSVDEKISADEWGHFMSGYAPIRGGKEQYLVGLDMRADEVYRKYHRLQAAGLISLGGSIALAFLLSRLLARHFVGGIKTFVAQCEVIASGSFRQKLALRAGDELDQLATAFNRMALSLNQANEELEDRVKLRTRELEQANEDLQEALAKVKQLHGLLPICAWCRKMRDDQGYWTELEHYLEAHADIKFSHGICPDCSKKFFPGQTPARSG